MKPLVWLLFAQLAHANCPPPPIPSVAEGDPSFDEGRTREVLQHLAIGALDMPDKRPVSHTAAALWTRRWQLECAARAGHVRSMDAMLREIAGEAAAWLDPAHSRPPAPARLDWQPAPPARTGSPLRSRVAGGLLLGVGVALAAGTIGLAADAAEWRLPGPCTTSICFNDLASTLHDTGIGVAVGFGLVGIAATVTGAVWLDGARHERRVQPTASGLRVSF